jgi:NTP pyrophosphatase (non-canonical NTP hydrolase)
MTKAHDNMAALQERAWNHSKSWFPTLHAKGGEYRVAHFTFGLAGETGEVVEVIKKGHRKDDFLGGINMEKLGQEMADVFSYLLDLAHEMQINLLEEYEKIEVANQARFEAGGWGG